MRIILLEIPTKKIKSATESHLSIFDILIKTMLEYDVNVDIF